MSSFKKNISRTTSGNVLKRTCLLDVFDVNYFFCSERLNVQDGFQVKRFARISYVSGVVAYIKMMVKGLFCLFKRKEQGAFPRNGIALVTQSGNNTAALQPVKNLYPDEACFVGPPAYAPAGPSVYGAAWVSVLFIPCFLWKWLRASAYQKRSVAYALDTTLLAYGYYLLSSLWFKKHAPRLVVFANDHSFFPRVFRAAALDMGVKTLYFQHASVTSNFPPLDFDYACLDGRDSLDKYREAGPVLSTVFLIGMAKSAQLNGQINHCGKVHAVGVCVNTLDDLEQIKKMIEKLRESVPDIPITWRPHPAMKLKFESMQTWGEKHNIQFSNPDHESIWDFMGEIDLLLAGNSSVHVEATLLNVTSIYVDFGDGRGDYYDFLKTGLVDRYDGAALVEKITSLREHRPSVRHRVAPFCADIGTSYEGRPDFLLECALKTILDECDLSDVFEKTADDWGCVYGPRCK